MLLGVRSIIGSWDLVFGLWVGEFGGMESSGGISTDEHHYGISLLLALF